MDVPLKPPRTSQRLKGARTKNYSSNTNGYIASYPVSLFTPLENLFLLATKLAQDCYRQRKTSKELIRNFILGVEKIRSELT